MPIAGNRARSPVLGVIGRHLHLPIGRKLVTRLWARQGTTFFLSQLLEHIDSEIVLLGSRTRLFKICSKLTLFKFLSIVYISFGYGFQIRWINIDKFVVFLNVYHISKFLLIKDDILWSKF